MEKSWGKEKEKEKEDRRLTNTVRDRKDCFFFSSFSRIRNPNGRLISSTRSSHVALDQECTSRTNEGTF